MTRFAFAGRHRATVAGLLVLAGCATSTESTSACTWVAGDLHVHSTYSYDAGPGGHYRGRSPAEIVEVAEERGLDFVALTDHDTTAGTRDEGWSSDQVILIPGYEASVKGHALVLGVDEVMHDPGRISQEEMTSLAERVRQAGGVVIAAHPRVFGLWGYDHDFVPDGVEVRNLAAEVNAKSNGESELWWEGFAEPRPAPVAGSDDHGDDENELGPHTRACVHERSVEGVLDAIRAGRTEVADRPAGRPR